VLHKTHEWRGCEGFYCVIHNPCPGPWSDWPTFWRDDGRFMERVCPCGIGHPAVEDRRASGSVHGCCGVHACSVKVIEGELIMKEIQR
jgi:hypothetical protein